MIERRRRIRWLRLTAGCLFLGIVAVVWREHDQQQRLQAWLEANERNLLTAVHRTTDLPVVRYYQMTNDWFGALKAVAMVSSDEDAEQLLDMDDCPVRLRVWLRTELNPETASEMQARYGADVEDRIPKTEWRARRQ